MNEEYLQADEYAVCCGGGRALCRRCRSWICRWSLSCISTAVGIRSRPKSIAAAAAASRCCRHPTSLILWFSAAGNASAVRGWNAIVDATAAARASAASLDGVSRAAAAELGIDRAAFCCCCWIFVSLVSIEACGSICGPLLRRSCLLEKLSNVDLAGNLADADPARSCFCLHTPTGCCISTHESMMKSRVPSLPLSLPPSGLIQRCPSAPSWLPVISSEFPLFTVISFCLMKPCHIIFMLCCACFLRYLSKTRVGSTEFPLEKLNLLMMSPSSLVSNKGVEVILRDIVRRRWIGFVAR